MVTTRSKKPPTSKAGTPAKPASQQEGEEDADSDDYECSDEEDLKPPPPEAVKKKTKAKSVQSGGSVSSGTSQRSRLDLHIEKQLLIDIEDQEGGLHYFDQADRLVLSRLLDTRPNIYGLRGEAIRSKIARRLRYLKQLHIRDYKLYIHSHHGLEAASLSKRQNLELKRKHKNTPLKQFQRRPDTVRPIVEEAVSDLDQDEEEEDDEDSCPGSSRKPAPNTASKSVTKPNLVSSVGKRNNPSHTKIAPAASAARHPDDLVPPPPKEERPIMSGAYAMKCMYSVSGFVSLTLPSSLTFLLFPCFLTASIGLQPHQRGTLLSQWISRSLGIIPRVFLWSPSRVTSSREMCTAESTSG